MTETTLQDTPITTITEQHTKEDDIAVMRKQLNEIMAEKKANEEKLRLAEKEREILEKEALKRELEEYKKIAEQHGYARANTGAALSNGNYIKEDPNLVDSKNKLYLEIISSLESDSPMDYNKVTKGLARNFFSNHNK